MQISTCVKSSPSSCVGRDVIHYELSDSVENMSIIIQKIFYMSEMRFSKFFLNSNVLILFSFRPYFEMKAKFNQTMEVGVQCSKSQDTYFTYNDHHRYLSKY